MYRFLLLLLVCLTFASAAPQDSSNIPSSSNITYVKIDPLPTSETEPEETETPFSLPIPFPANHRKSKTLEFVDTGYEENTSVVFDNEVNDEETQPDSDKYVILHSEATTINFESGETEDVTTVATERERKPSTFRTVTESLDFPIIRTTLPPKFIPKTSYYSKQNSKDRSLSTANRVEKRITLRKFRSKCRCEKIWNCPKLQITVPRCPNEYFLCCF